MMYMYENSERSKMSKEKELYDRDGHSFGFYIKCGICIDKEHIGRMPEVWELGRD